MQRGSAASGFRSSLFFFLLYTQYFCSDKHFLFYNRGSFNFNYLLLLGSSLERCDPRDRASKTFGEMRGVPITYFVFLAQSACGSLGNNIWNNIFLIHSQHQRSEMAILFFGSARRAAIMCKYL